MTTEPKLCRIETCPKRAQAKGLCNGHYQKLRRYGDPLATGQLAPNGLARDELFIRKVDKTSNPDGCWRWLGKIDKRGKGYGQFTYRDPETGEPRSVGAHRYAYELWVGPIPKGLSIDHVWDSGCRYTDCVRAPGHLEPVTPAEQNRRYYSRQTHCKRGNHPLSGDNLLINNTGARVCRTCQAEAKRAYMDRQIEIRRANPKPLKTHCKNGHEFTPENVRIGGKLGTTRLCKQCARDANARQRAKLLSA
jgi:hypothetical protein